MPRKRPQQYRRPPRRIPVDNEGRAAEVIEVGAARMVASQTVDELRLMVRRSQEVKDWADQQAQDDPSPEALSRFRAAALQLAQVERALVVAERSA